MLTTSMLRYVDVNDLSQEMTDTMIVTPLEIFVSLRRTMLMCILGVLMTAGSIFCVVVVGSVVGVVAGVIGTLFFGFCTIKAVTQLFRHSPMFTIDAQGLHDHRSHGLGLIESADIREVWLMQVQNQPMLCVEVDDTGKYLGRLPLVSRKMAKLNRGLGCAEITLSLSGLSHTPQEVMAYLDESFPDWLMDPDCME